MAEIYDYDDGMPLTVGLQGSSACDEAIICAHEYAKELERPVVLCDDDGTWIVEPNGSVRKPVARDGDWDDSEHEEEL